MTRKLDTSMTAKKSMRCRYLSGFFVLFFCLWLIPVAHGSTLFGEVVRASDSEPGSAFGFDVSIDHGSAAIGAWFGSGAVYIVELDADSGAWQQTHKIETPDSAAGKGNFGFSVSLDGEQLVVGAPNILLTSPGAVAGFAFIYQRDAADGGWQLVHSIEGASAPDEFPPQGLGRAVAVDQGVAAISRTDQDTDVVLIYQRNLLTGDWVQSDTLLFDELDSSEVGTVSARVGELAIDNNRLAVALISEDSSGLSGFEIRLFDYNDESGRWSESHRLDERAGLATANAFRGMKLDNHQLLLAGAEGESPILFLYDAGVDQWLRDSTFSSDVSVVRTGSLSTFDIEGSRVVLEGEGGNAIVYEKDGGTGRWAETLRLSNALLGADSPEVTSIDLAGDHILIGVPYVEGFTGAVLAYRLDDLDADGVAAVDDNCPEDFNPAQENFDGDLLGDACDLDDDNDGVGDDNDGFPLDPDQQDSPVGSVQSEAPGVPQPVWPFGNRIALETDYRWSAVANATYYVIEVQHNNSIRAYEPTITVNSACLDGQCRYIKSDAARHGANRWRLRAGNDAGVSAWSPWVEFIVGLSDGAGGDSPDSAAFAQIPVIPVSQLPVGNTNRSASNYVWSAVPGAIDYAIEVQHEGLIRAYEPSIPAAEVCTSGQCSYGKSDAALPGLNRWRVRAINNMGSSVWSDWVTFAVSNIADDPTASVDTDMPPVPVPLSPGDESISQVADYRWNDVSGATVYSVEVQHMESIRGYNENLLASEACGSEGCIYSKSDAALQGANRWRVRSGNNNGFSAWSDWQVFTIP